MDDSERLAAARTFFWQVMERTGDVVTPQEADRAIRKLVEALPPFTPIRRVPA